MTKPPINHQDPWAFLRRYTNARIALGHAGGSVPTKAILEFRLAHAKARDAVYRALDLDSMQISLKPLGLAQHKVRSKIEDRTHYLQRPDLGRQLHPDSLHILQTESASPKVDIVFVIADGLSALAVEQHAAALLLEVIPLLRQQDFNIGPIIVAEQARVALGDEIGAALQARLLVMLIGERPGLSSPDSVGVYLTWGPKPGRMDSERNCISNVRPDGLPIKTAAHKLHFLIKQSLHRQLSGIHLKDESVEAIGNKDANHFIIKD